MNENPEKKEARTKPEKTGESISFHEESSSSEKARGEQTESKKRFCGNTLNEVKNIEMGALFTLVENLYDSAKTFDSKVTTKADSLLSKVTGYFRNSIDSYNKTRKKH